jgi:hypothetical protein
MDDRFQNQPWYIKLWRYRHYFWIPFRATLFYFRQEDDDDEKLRFRDCWGISKGYAQTHMKWYFTLEEMDDIFRDEE